MRYLKFKGITNLMYGDVGLLVDKGIVTYILTPGDYASG